MSSQLVKVVDFLRVLAAALVCVAAPTLFAADRQCAQPTQLATLIAESDAHHGKAFWVVAYATIEFENMTICPSETERRTQSCLWLTIDDGPFDTDADHTRYRSKLKAWEQFTLQTVAIRATFDKNSRGHFGMWPGGLVSVAEVLGHDGGWDFRANAAVPKSKCVAAYRLPKQPADRRAMISGNQKLQRGDIDGAISDFGHAIALAPGNGGYYLIRANAHERKRDYAGAIADYTRAIEIARTDKDILYTMRGAAKEQLGDLRDAIADYSRAIELNPNDADAYRRRGNTKNKLGDARGAAVDLAAATRLERKNGSP